MPDVQHSSLSGSQLHVPGFVQSSDPGAVGAGVAWVDTTTSGAWLLKIRNDADSGWQIIDTVNVFHSDEDSEITVLSEKTDPASADVLIIEDTEDGNSKKKLQIGNLPTSSGGGSGSSDFLGLTDTPTTYSGSSGKTLQVKSDEGGLEFITNADTVNISTGSVNPSGGNEGDLYFHTVDRSLWQKRDDSLSGRLIAYFDFEDTSGGLTDQHNNSISTTENGNPSYSQTGIISDAVALDGSGDYFTLDSLANYYSANDPFFISTWFKTSHSGGANDNILFSMHDASGANMFRLGITGSGEVFVAAENGLQENTNNQTAGSGYNDDSFHHLVFVVDGLGYHTIFVDNTNLNTETSGAIPWKNISQVSIGQEYDGGTPSDYFTGTLDEMGFWNREPTENEISDLYNSGSGLAYPLTISSPEWRKQIDGLPVLTGVSQAGVLETQVFS